MNQTHQRGSVKGCMVTKHERLSKDRSDDKSWRISIVAAVSLLSMGSPLAPYSVCWPFARYKSTALQSNCTTAHFSFFA